MTLRSWMAGLLLSVIVSSSGWAQGPVGNWIADNYSAGLGQTYFFNPRRGIRTSSVHYSIRIKETSKSGARELHDTR